MAVLCQIADPQSYVAFDWQQDEEDRGYWLDLFSGFPANIERHLREDGLTGDDFENRWRAFLAEYHAGIEARRRDPEFLEHMSTVALGEFRQSMMDKHGWPDPYLQVKRRENEMAAGLYPDVIAEVDATPMNERWELLLRGLFAGNMFDLGSPATIAMHANGELGFHAMLDRIPDRPWPIDHANVVRNRLESIDRWRQILFFVDNAGTDIVLGVIPMVRELARMGVRVVMAANSTPALNDITCDELNVLLEKLSVGDRLLGTLLADDRVVTVASGSGCPLIDLSKVSDECNGAAADSDLIVLEGMGRGVESNWQQAFRCDVWRVALVKDRCVAKWLGCDLFDPVCRFDPAGS